MDKESSKFMIRSALHIYRKNIWNIFAVTGIVALGVVVAIMVASPVIYNLLFYNVTKIISSATAIPQSGFNLNAFIESLNKQFNGLNWNNPIASITGLLDSKGYIRMFTQALMDSGFQKEVVSGLLDTIALCADDLVAGIKEQLIFMLTCIVASGIVAFIAPRVVVQLRTARTRSAHKDKDRKRNILRFAILFFLNLITVLAAYAGIILILVFTTLNILEFIFAILGILLVLVTLTFLWPIVCYRDRRLKFTTLFNLKTFGAYLLACLIVLAISAAIFVICFFISDVIGLLLILPLIFVTNIIMENIVISYANNYYKIKRAQNKRRALKTEKAKAAA